MSEQKPSGGQPTMPEPTLVHDVTYQHIYFGQVYKQFYVFLWVSLALLVGAILPWNGPFSGKEGYTLWQLLMMIFSAGCVWNAYQCIKGRRLTLWPILAVEIIGVLLVLVHYRDVESQVNVLRYNGIAAIQHEIDTMPESMRTKAEYNEVLVARLAGTKAAFEDGDVGGSFTALFGFGSSYINSDLESRATAEAQLNAFGMGFHLTWLTLGFVLVFMVGSTIFAIVTAKPKEDPAEARRKARTSLKKDESAPGGDAGETGEKS